MIVSVTLMRHRDRQRYLAAPSLALACFIAQAAGTPKLAAAAKPATVSNAATSFETTPADGYRGIWYAVGPTDDEFAYKYSGGMGTYCAKHNPFAVYRPEVNKTFFCYGGATQDSLTRLVHMVSYFDHRTGKVARPRILLDKRTNDAHDNPVISMDDQGHLWVFSTSHGRSRPSFIHRSVEPYSIERFERVTATYEIDGKRQPLNNFSYMQMWRTPAHGFTTFFTRYKSPADRTSMFMTSKDGVTWSACQRIAAMERGHYQISAVQGNKAAAAFNYHPRKKGLDYRTNLYFIQTLDGGKTWTTVQGEEVRVPLTSPKSKCLVYDFKREKKNVYLKDIAFDPQGRPALLVITSFGHEPGPQNGPREWVLFRWLDDHWQQSLVTTSDNNYDLGSLYIEQDLWRIVAPTVGVPQAFNPGGEIVAWISRDQGATWKKEQQLTINSQLNNNYARRPVNAHPDFYAIWADGHGRRASKSRLYFCNSKGQVYRLPTRMKSPMAKPVPVNAHPREQHP